MLFTTRQLLHKNYACTKRFRHFFRRYHRVDENELIPLIDVLERNGLDDALWCLRATTVPCESFARLFAADCAEHVLPLFETNFPDNPAPRRAIEVARQLARGEATGQECRDARIAALAACDAAADEAVVVPGAAASDAYLAASAAAYTAAVAAAYTADAAADEAAEQAVAAACFAARAPAEEAAAAAAARAATEPDAYLAAVAAARAKWDAATEAELLWQTAKFREALLAHNSEREEN